MTDTPPTYTTTPTAPAGGIMSPITPDPVGTPEKTVMGYIRGCLQPYVNFDGRARRKEFGLFALALFVSFIAIWIIMAVLGLIVGAAGSADQSGTAGMVGGGILGLIGLLLYAVVGLGTIIPLWGVAIRRAHDAGFPWWIGAICMVFNGIGFWVLLLMPSQEGANIYGPYPKPRV